jgi:plasmid stabilization system protein ParE
MPAEERAGYIWLTLQRVRELYALEHGEMEPDEAKEFADHLQTWTEATVEMLEIGRDRGPVGRHLGIRSIKSASSTR